jgi:hypothetical protein
MSRCASCKQKIAGGLPQRRQVTIFVYPDGHEEATNSVDGLVASPGGKLKAVMCYKCAKVIQRHIARRKSAGRDGSLMGSAHIPTAYETADMDTQSLVDSEQANRERREESMEWPAGGTVTAEVGDLRDVLQGPNPAVSPTAPEPDGDEDAENNVRPGEQAPAG